MDPLTLLATTVPAVAPWIPYLVAAAAVISMFLPPPAPPADGSPATGVYAGVYRAANLLGANRGFARNATG